MPCSTACPSGHYGSSPSPEVPAACSLHHIGDFGLLLVRGSCGARFIGSRVGARACSLRTRFESTHLRYLQEKSGSSLLACSPGSSQLTRLYLHRIELSLLPACQVVSTAADPLIACEREIVSAKAFVRAGHG